jgi:hypothetical protein
MNKGAIYLLTGPAHAVGMVVSLRSLRNHFDGPVTIFTAHPASHEVGQRRMADPRLAQWAPGWDRRLAGYLKLRRRQTR